MANGYGDSGVQITGGQVVAGNIGGSGNHGTINAPVAQNTAAADPAVAAVLEQLRVELARVRAMLEATDGRAANPHEVVEIIDALSSDVPVAQSKWASLMQRLPDALSAVEAVSRVGQLFGQLVAGA
ncbi:hypothetical protein [Nocardia asteroides]|uniref:hypothetical protein n=1 Tax=Nocardia asteroides TaxID=1824 RepID=UPI001E4B0C69|nr:hypothetical protein [Nocardia asteroides]UGT53406.1 hypothetical protein LTT85_22315 [Nocardia asteroides]